MGVAVCGAVEWGAAGVGGEGVDAAGVPLRRTLVLLNHAAAAARASLRKDHRGSVVV